MMVIDDERTERVIAMYLCDLVELERKHSEAHTERWRCTLDGKMKRTQADIGYMIHSAMVDGKLTFRE